MDQCLQPLQLYEDQAIRGSFKNVSKNKLLATVMTKWRSDLKYRFLKVGFFLQTPGFHAVEIYLNRKHSKQANISFIRLENILTGPVSCSVFSTDLFTTLTLNCPSNHKHMATKLAQMCGLCDRL